MQRSRGKLGLWLIGASGNVATTVAVGLAVLQKKRIPTIGLVTEQPSFQRLGLRPLSAICLGGHEIRRHRPLDTARELHRHSGVFDEEMLRAAAPALAAFRKNIRAGTTALCGRAIGRLAARPDVDGPDPGRTIIDRLRKDLRGFARRNNIDRVVVINVASTEPPLDLKSVHRAWTRLDAALRRNRRPVLPASSLYAIAAIEESMPYVNFTPSAGADVPAIRELAGRLGVPIMGADGKTGETLVKTVLAPMFRGRGLEVLSWVGHNILGNRDAVILDSPANKASKIGTKDRVVGEMLGYEPQTHTSIECLESLHDWKTAWNHIHFRGFLGTKMSLQFTWQGCDSILAAPLVIDLARLADHHAGRGRAGVMTHLACFFKSPMDVREHDFFAQVAALERYVAGDLKRGKDHS